ncbi:MAG: hypothetical protein RL595_814 [Planctomycetota bacterium]
MKEDSNFSRWHFAIETLAAFMRQGAIFFDSIRLNPSSVQGWADLDARFSSYNRLKSPVMVATLYGPSGSGKSTIFKNLTGVEVPAGGAIRPCSMACAAAVPEALCSNLVVGDLFPMHAPLPLESPAQIRSPSGPGQILFASYANQSNAPVDLVLVDVPDFNTVETTNWDKAEKILERSQVVIFIVYDNGYSDEKVVRELMRCCSKSAYLAYVLTMTEKENAIQIWKDLLTKVTSRFEGFSQNRSDGKSLAQFLEQSPVYYSPRTNSPKLSDVQPLNNESPPFESLLRGLKAEAIILSGLMEPARQAVHSSEMVLEKFQAELAANELKERKFLKDLSDCASKVACHEFPTPRLVEIILEESRRRRAWWLKVVTKPLEFPGIAWRNSGKKILDWFKPGSSESAHIVDRETLERQRIQESIEWMENRWRGDNPSMAGVEGELSASRCSKARAVFQQSVWPPAGLDWEKESRSELEKWASENRMKCALLATIPEVAMGSGMLVLVADLCTTGGAFTSILANLGMGGMIGGALTSIGLGAKFLEEYHLKAVVNQAQERWNEQRACELRQHLAQNWMIALLGDWQSHLETLRKAPLKPFQQAVRKLKSLLQRDQNP